MTRPIWHWTATETAAAIRAGRITSQEVTQAHLDRMHAVNPAINAVVVDMSASAMVQAAAADTALATAETLGPLHGVPITVKQNADVKGFANLNGLPAHANLIAPTDAPVVANLRKAGAIIIGQTNTPELSLRAFTDNPVHGLTLNPWDKDITCGGSSGGAGAALAAGIGALAHGNDIGGSLRWPAHCNGIATIRPTQGRIPAWNDSATAERPLMAQLFSTQGPMCRTVEDTKLGLEVMSARDPRDPWWVPAPLSFAAPEGPIRVAMAKVPDDMHPDPGVLALYRRAADHLANAGYEVTEIDLPNVTEIWQGWADLLFDEIVTLQEAAITPVTSAAFHQVLAAYKRFSNPLDKAGYMQAIANRTGHLRRWMALLEDYPVILSPVSVQDTPGPRADLDSDTAVFDLFNHAMRYVGVMNYLGLPTAVAPVGLHNGHPIGVQLTATKFREDIALHAAQAIEYGAGTLLPQLWAKLG